MIKYNFSYFILNNSHFMTFYLYFYWMLIDKGKFVYYEVGIGYNWN